MGFFERFFARKKPNVSEPTHSPYILPGEMGYPGDRPRSATAVVAPPPPPPPPPPPVAPPVEIPLEQPPVALEPAVEPGAQTPVQTWVPAAPAPPPAAFRERPKAVAHEPATADGEEENPFQELEPTVGRPGAAWVILEDGTVAYLPGDQELKERMRYLADNLLPPSEGEGEAAETPREDAP